MRQIRHYSLVDQLLIQIDQALTTLLADSISRRPNPATQIDETLLTSVEKQQSARLMRVNHSGEICAQALYYGQLLLARGGNTQKMLSQAALEETDHLAWTAQRLSELQSHTSYLNFFWYCNSMLIGMLAGLSGDQWSLGFIEETEQQVSEHLQKHLARLPAADKKSIAIVQQMQADELHHQHQAQQAGAHSLPKPIQWLMSLHAKVMTTVAYWI